MPEKIRLLRCNDCKTLEEFPNYEGPQEQDVLLETMLSGHETAGHRHRGRLFDVDARVWRIPALRKKIIEEVWAGGSKGLAEFDPDYYAVRDTFKEDALLCYSQHSRPQEGCGDWRSDRKRLMPATKADRKEVGLTMEGAPVRYLCDFCPVRSYYERKNRDG